MGEVGLVGGEFTTLIPSKLQLCLIVGMVVMDRLFFRKKSTFQDLHLLKVKKTKTDTNT